MKLSSKRQITIPVRICRQLSIKEGDQLTVDVIDNRIVIIKTPASYTEHFSGIANGALGKTAEEINAYIADERNPWE